MAISVVLDFHKEGGGVTAIYDAIIEEMGVQNNPPPGAIYHWAAPRGADGLRVVDVWETAEAFQAFSSSQTEPLTRKHGLAPPSVTVADVYSTLCGEAPSREGIGVVFDVAGHPDALRKQYDAINEMAHVISSPPEGLIFHSAWMTPSGFRVIDHWRSREDLERFMETRLAPAFGQVGLPQPALEFFDVHNAIDARKVARPAG